MADRGAVGKSRQLRRWPACLRDEARHEWTVLQLTKFNVTSKNLALDQAAFDAPAIARYVSVLQDYICNTNSFGALWNMIVSL